MRETDFVSISRRDVPSDSGVRERLLVPGGAHAEIHARAASIERTGAALAVALDSVDEEGVAAVLEDLERRADQPAAAFLSVLAAVGSMPVAAAAHQALERLRRAGGGRACEAPLTRPSLASASSQPLEGRELLTASLRTPRDGSRQLCWFLVLGPWIGGRLIAAGVRYPNRGDRLPWARSAASHSPRLPAASLAERLALAAECTRAARLGLPFEGTVALRLVWLALRPAARLPDVPLLEEVGAQELVVDPVDDGDRLSELMDRLLDEFEREVAAVHGVDDAVWRSGDFAGGAMLEFKGRYADGWLTRWTTAEVDEFLLRWFPHSVIADDEIVEDLPECVSAFLRFLAQRGSLRGDPLPSLEAACADAGAELRSTYGAVRREGTPAAVQRALRRRTRGFATYGTSASAPVGRSVKR